jgi:hypothetical protein
MTNSNKSAKGWFTVALFVAALAAPRSAPAAAYLFPSLGSVASYAVFGMTGGTLTETPAAVATIIGNEGISSGTFTANSNATVKGSIYEAAGVTQTGSPTMVGGGSIIYLSQNLTSVNTDIQTVLASIAAIPSASATQTITTQISGAQNITGNGSGIAAANVIDFTNTNLGTLANANITLNGGSNDYFVVRIYAAGLTLTGTGSLALGTGVLASHVIFDFLGAAGNTIAAGGGVMNGYIYAQNQNLTLTGTTVNGDLISGKTITLNSGTTVNQITPEPSTLFLIGGALIAIGAGSKRLRKG